MAARDFINGPAEPFPSQPGLKVPRKESIVFADDDVNSDVGPPLEIRPLQAAIGVAGGANVTTADVVEGVANLVAKSLITAEVVGASVTYHRLDTTRAYAVEKLRASGEFGRVARRYAESCPTLVEETEDHARIRA